MALRGGFAWWNLPARGKPAARRGSARERCGLMRQAVIEALEERLLLSAAHDQVGLTALRADSNFSGINGAGITIAFFDSGVYADNPALKNNFIGYINAVSPVSANSLVLDTNPADADADAEKSDEGHGTHTAGIAASTNPEIGAATGAKFIEIRNLPYPGEVQTVNDEFHPGMLWILHNASTYNIKVVNISEGDPSVNSDDPAAQARQESQLASDILSLENAGIAVVVSSGNNYAEFADGTPDELGNSSPAVFSKIAVGNTIADTIDPTTLDQPFGGGGPDYYAESTALGSPDDIEATSQRSNLSNQVFAPGDNITSTWLGSGTKTESGTSMSAPLVAGIVALMQQEAFALGHSYLTVSEIANILQSTADTIVDNSISTNFRFSAASFSEVGVLPTTGLSFKRVNADKALQFVRALFTIPQGQQFLAIGGPIQQMPDLNGTEAFDASGSLTHPNDVTLYKVNIDETANFKLFLTLPINGGAAFNGELRLFDANGTEISSTSGVVNATSNLTLQTDPTLPLATGSYYIGVSSLGNSAYDPVAGDGAANGTSTGDYRLNVNIINPDPNGVVSGADTVDLKTPDGYADLSTPASHITHTTGYSEFSGFLGSDPAVSGSVDTGRVNIDNGDVDMYKLQAPDDGVISVTTDNSGGGLTGNVFVRIFQAHSDGSLTIVTQTAGNLGGLSTGTLTFVAQIGVTYYIGLSTFANEVYDLQNPYNRPANSTPHTNPLNYDLQIVFDNNDRNGTGFTAVDETVGTTVSDQIGKDNATFLYDTDPTNGRASLPNFSKDVDWYAYTAAADGELDMKISGTGSGFTADMGLWFYDSTAGVFTRITDAGGASELILPVLSGDTIYVTVSDQKNSDFSWDTVASGSGGATGNYTLTSSLLPTTAFKTENNDTLNFGTPTPVSLATTMEGNIGKDAVGKNGALVEDGFDVDLYTFRAPTNGVVTLSTLTQTETDANTVVRVFDASGNPLVSSQTIPTKSLGGRVNVTVVAGQTYIVGVSGAAFDTSDYSAVNGTNGQSGSVGHYRLTLSNVIAAPVRVIVASQPQSAIGGVPMVPPIQINVVDVNNRTVSGDASMVTLKIVTGPAGATLGGTVTVQAQDGVVVFNTLAFSKPGTYTLQATDAGLFSATLNPINVTLPATHLVFTQMPASAVAGAAFGLMVSLEDATGQVVSTDQSNVTVGVFSGAGGAVGALLGTLTTQAQSGKATFAGLSMTSSGTFVLAAIDGGLTAGKSGNLLITAATASTHLALIQQPFGSVVGKAMTPALVLGVEDGFGNLVLTDHSKVGLNMVSASSGGSLSGTTVVTVTNGMATFSGAILSAVGDYMLSASDGSLTITTPVQFEELITTGPTTVVVPKVAASYTFGQALVLTTTLKSQAPATILFGGTASIVDGGNNILGTAAVATNGAVKFTLTGAVAPGNYACTLVYGGDANHAAVTSSGFTILINQATTTTAVTTSAAALAFGQAVTLTAKISSTTAPGVARTGTVTFYDGVTQIGSPVAVNGSSSASIVYTPLAVGTHAFKAIYSGDLDFKLSTSAVASRAVAKDKTAILLTPSAPGPIVPGTSEDLTAHVTVAAPGVNVPAGLVTFKDGTKVLGTVALDGNGTATLPSLNFTAPGTHTITAVYAGDADDNAITSTVLKLVVT